MLPLLSGRTTTASKAHCAFWTIILLTITFYFLPFLQCYITYPNTEGNNSYYNDQSTDCIQNVFNSNLTQTQTTFGTVSSILILILILMVVRTRRQIRKKYNIPGNCCHDCCAAVLCNCCTVSQMMRHTADYDTYRAVCCSETGMCAGAPVIVWGEEEKKRDEWRARVGRLLILLFHHFISIIELRFHHNICIFKVI